MTDTNNATENTTTEAAAPKAPSKMDRAKEIFAELKDASKVAEGKTARATFIDRAVAELQMSKQGAATYWQNLTSLDKGGKLYPHSGSKKKVEGELEAPVADDKAPEEAPADNAEDQGDSSGAEDLSHLDK